MFLLQRLKKLSHHLSIQWELYLLLNRKKNIFFSYKKRNKKNHSSFIHTVVKLTNVSPFGWWFWTGFFDGSIFTLLFTKNGETSDGITQVEEIFRFLKYCSRQIYAKDRMPYPSYPCRLTHTHACIFIREEILWHLKDENLYFSINCADEIVLFRLFGNLWFFMTHLKWEM